MDYVDINPSEFSRALGTNASTVVVYTVTDHSVIAECNFPLPLGMRQSISVEALINFLKEWCVKPEADDQEQRLPGDESEGAKFTSTVQHIHNIYNYLHTNCSHSSLKELFQHTPAVFIEYNRYVASSTVLAFLFSLMLKCEH